jgi:hypothetical protein
LYSPSLRGKSYRSPCSFLVFPLHEGERNPRMTFLDFGIYFIDLYPKMDIFKNINIFLVKKSFMKKLKQELQDRGLLYQYTDDKLFEKFDKGE